MGDDMINSRYKGEGSAGLKPVHEPPHGKQSAGQSAGYVQPWRAGRPANIEALTDALGFVLRKGRSLG